MMIRLHCFVAPLILLVLDAVVVVQAASPAATTGSSKRPTWLDHIDRDTIQEYMDKAKKQHDTCISQARSSYDVQPTESDSMITDVKLDTYSIKSNGKLPDFDKELEKKCFVTSAPTPLFSKEECNDLISKVEDHFQKTNDGKWSTLPSGQYDVAGFWIRDIPEAHEWFLNMVQKRLFPLLAQSFPEFCGNKDALVVDNAYLFKYTPETGRRTDVHTDSGCLSFTIALNSNQEYRGGGTWFEGLQGGKDVIEMDRGQVTFRPGGVRHCGHAVTEGTRYIIGGFCMDHRRIEYVRMLMRYAHDTQDPKEEQKALEVAIALNPNFDAPYTVLADVYKKQGNMPGAQKALEHCLEQVNPQCGEVAYSLGNIYYENENYEDAKKCMQVCLDVDDSDVDAMAIMAQVAARTQNQKDEESWYKRILETPIATKKQSASAYCNLGVLHEGADEEITFYQKSLEYVPDSFAARYSLACAHAVQSQYREAAKEFRAVLSSTQTNQENVQPEQTMNALKNLYRVALEIMKIDIPNPQTREEMMDKIQEVMGIENYNKLAASAGK